MKIFLVENLWNKASPKRCHSLSFTLWAQLGNITNLTSWSCFLLSHTSERAEQEEHGHSEQGDSKQQDFPTSTFYCKDKVALSQHYLLARQLLNSPTLQLLSHWSIFPQHLLLLLPPSTQEELLQNKMQKPWETHIKFSYRDSNFITFQ